MTKKTGFSLDFNDTFGGYEKIKNGTYEVIIDHATEGATPSGAEYTEFRMTIRNDLDQPHVNLKIWERVWKAKATGKYNMMMFNTIGKAAQLENGKTYNNFDELLEDYANKPVQVFVKNETSEYKGKTYENLNVKSWNKTKFPSIQHEFKEGAGGSGSKTETIEIDSDDLPF